ncbi:MAG: SulP family inorganic anion transporter [Anaerolineae bacterium]|nr:SulP family inorganic anion transporter [Anaerolineae bacterium]
MTERLSHYVQRSFTADLIAGLTGATAGVPQAMAFAILAGIDPFYGLYTAIVSTIVSGLCGRASLLTTGPTNALAVVVGSTLAPFTGSDDLLARLVTLTVLVGVIQLLMGLLRLGELTRYVSVAVMTGFVTGAASLVILGQIGSLTGVSTGSYSRAVLRVANLISHFDQFHWRTFLIGAATIGIIVWLHQTRYTTFATLAAIVVTGAAVAVLGWDTQGVGIVSTLSEIPDHLPAFTLPEVSYIDDMLTAALAIAVLGLVQTAALSQEIEEPNEQVAHASTTNNASREFIGQGLGNIAGAFFQSMPAGGSLSRTAINIIAGAHTRLANVWAGVFVALIMLLFSGLAEHVVLASLAGHLIVAAAMLIDLDQIRLVWAASWTGRAAMMATFISTWVLPLEYSVYIGVVLSLALYLYQSSRIQLMQLEPLGDNTFREIAMGDTLPDNGPVILSIHGHLYFAAMHDLLEKLPKPDDSNHPVVILRLRGDEMLAGTGTKLLVSYAEQLRAQDGKLILCGVGAQVMDTLVRTNSIHDIGEENIFPAGKVLLTSTQKALDYAHDWLDEQTDL